LNLELLKRELNEAGPSVVHKLYEFGLKKRNFKFLYYGEENQYLSYGEFNALTNKIANYLQSAGIEKGDKISVYLYHPVVTALVMFGIMKAGAVFSPINFNYKGRLLSYQINDTEPRMLITEQSRIPFINDIKSDLPALKIIVRKPAREEHDYKQEDDAQELNPKFEKIEYEDLFGESDANLDTEINYWDVASIIYTSGTTGAAKGVVQSHRWLSSYIFTARRITHADEIHYNDLPMYHIAGAFGALARVIWTGSSIALWDKFSPKDFWKRIEKSGSSTAALMDVMMPWLMNAEETPKDRHNTLKWVNMQPIPQYHNKIARRFGFDIVTVGYGSTETGIPIAGIIDEMPGEEGTPEEFYKGYPKEYMIEKYAECGYPVLKGSDDIKKGFMGRAFTLQPAIINEKDEILGPGEYGQLAFRSKLPYCLPFEYFKKPEATVAAYRNLWFHTGDACVRDEKDTYYFIDRMGSFIRVRGENISSYQIEDILNSHSSVEVAAVFPIPAEVGEEDDIAVYVKAKTGSNLNEENLRMWIASEMPKFMWPKYIRFIEELPHTATNKIEKYKLKDMILKELKRS
jgi:crotonobetaine/carnitine-CoA ligase